jgi:hypothetical protein
MFVEMKRLNVCLIEPKLLVLWKAFRWESVIGEFRKSLHLQTNYSNLYQRMNFWRELVG